MALTGQVPDIRHPFRAAVQGLGAVPQLSVLPHFDRFAGRLPDVVLTRVSTRRRASLGGHRRGHRAGLRLARRPGEWDVVGRQSVWVLTPPAALAEEHPAGSVLRLGAVG